MNHPLSKVVTAFVLAMWFCHSSAGEFSLQSDVTSRVEYNDNIFLTNLEHDDAFALVIIPSITGKYKEEHWETFLDAKIRSNNYSDDNLDSNDQFVDFLVRYNAQRNIFTLNANYDLDSSLNSTSQDFGIVGRRINRKNQSISPQYTRLLTERLYLNLSYSYADVEYLEAENTGFTSYTSESVMTSLSYNLTERDVISIILQGVDYEADDKTVTYDLIVTRFGVTHEFSETTSADFQTGVSRRNSKNLSVQIINFLGAQIPFVQEVTAEDRGFVLDAGITRQFESSDFEARVSRDNTTNSFGGLNQVDRYSVRYTDDVSALWRYTLKARYEDITGISATTSDTDRDIIFLESTLKYVIARDWDFVASYRYIQRKFKSDTSDNIAPHSNRIYFGVTYNFPLLSTF